MAFLHGFLLALGLILPLGVQNTFVFNQGAVQPRFRRALPAVLTAFFCDLALILVSVLGVAVLVLRVSVVKYILLTVGILFLIYMGVVTWKSAASDEKKNQEAANEEAGSNETADSEEITTQARAISPKKQILFAASVSLLNPHAILDTVGVIGTSSLQYSGIDKLLYTLACILVSLLWFFFLAGAGRMIGKINAAILPLINRVSAVIMWGSALYLATSLL